MVLWRLTSQSFCKGTYKVYNLQLFARNLTLFRNVFYISSSASIFLFITFNFIGL